MSDNILEFVQFNDKYLLVNAMDKPIKKEHFDPIIITAQYPETIEYSHATSSLTNNTIKSEYFNLFTISQISQLKQLGYITHIITDKKMERESVVGDIIFISETAIIFKNIKFPYYDYTYLRLKGWLTKTADKIIFFNDEEKVYKIKQYSGQSLNEAAIPFLQKNYPNLKIIINTPEPRTPIIYDLTINNYEHKPTTGDMFIAYINKKYNEKNTTELESVAPIII